MSFTPITDESQTALDEVILSEVMSQNHFEKSVAADEHIRERTLQRIASDIKIRSSSIGGSGGNGGGANYFDEGLESDDDDEEGEVVGSPSNSRSLSQPRGLNKPPQSPRNINLMHPPFPLPHMMQQSNSINNAAALVPALTDPRDLPEKIGLMRPLKEAEAMETSPQTKIEVKIDFQRVTISKTNDPVDSDTKDACKKLKKCLQMREKWLSAHPEPPQDRVPRPVSPKRFDSSTNLPDEATRSASGGSLGVGSSGGGYKKRQPPEYDIDFSSPLPDVCDLYRYQLVKGVMHVYNVSNKVPIYSPDSFKTTVATVTPVAVPPLPLPLSSILSNTTLASGPVEAPLPPPAPTLKPPSVDVAPTLPKSIFPVNSFEDFVSDFNAVRNIVHGGPTISYSYKRLELLQAKFNFHVLLNANRELEIQKSVPHRDFYNIRKVDTHVHHSACMNQKYLLRFIKRKLRENADEVVVYRDGKFLTLGEVFKSLSLTSYHLSIDTLDMHANNTFHRFDRFNLKYNPAGQSRLREIFLKTENVIGGRYLAEITQGVIQELEQSKYQLAEWRLSIYGRKASEWESLSKWVYTHKLVSPSIRWLIQIPRLFHIYKSSGEIRSFGQMLHNIFAPLFAVSLNPASNPPLHYFLNHVVGFDSVDDESRPEHGQLSYGVENIANPDDWTSALNPPYGYWMYFMYANICVLNKLRASLGLCTFQFRPHCGEAGDVDHLVSTYLLADQINHGIQLRQNASLQYLYYLSQIGIAMSPLSNNKLFLDYNKNPFPKYFKQGLNVSLSTDDPLMLHYTKDPLLEEYSVATQVWKLSSTDQCEIARNSVLQSGWERRFKQYFLGANYRKIEATNVPSIRLDFRQETLDQEHQAIDETNAQTASK